MPISKNLQDRDFESFAENANGDTARRVIITEPAADDQAAPTNLVLSNNIIEENLPNNSLIGVLSVTGGLPPIVFTVEQDDSNAVQIVGNQLQTSRVLTAADDASFNVGVRCTDANGNFTISNFTITVTEIAGFLNQKSYEFNGVDSFIVFPERLHTNGGTITQNFSIGFWVKINNFTAASTIFSTKDASGNNGVHLRLTGASNRFEISGTKDNGNTKTFRYAIPAGFVASDWNLFGITYKRSTDEFLFYINAIQRPVGSAISDQTFSNSFFDENDTYIGRAPQGGSYFDGRIDEAFFSPDAYDATDWVLAYNGGAAPNLDTLGKNIDHWYRAESDIFPIVKDVKETTDGAETNVTIVNDSPTEFSNNLSVSFDGATNYFIGSGVPDFSLPKTISFWLNRTTPLQTDLIFSWNATTTTSVNSAKIYMDNNSAQRIYFRIDSPSGDIIQRWSLDASSLNTWNHICITGSDFTDANTINLYRNGILLTPNQTTNTLTVLPTIPDKFAIGGGITGGSLFNGLLDEYSVFDIEADQTQVEELFNFANPSNLAQISFADDLVQWYRFGDRNAQSSVMNNQSGADAVVMINYNQSFYVGDTP